MKNQVKYEEKDHEIPFSKEKMKIASPSQDEASYLQVCYNEQYFHLSLTIPGISTSLVYFLVRESICHGD